MKPDESKADNQGVTADAANQRGKQRTKPRGKIRVTHDEDDNPSVSMTPMPDDMDFVDAVVEAQRDAARLPLPDRRKTLDYYRSMLEGAKRSADFVGKDVEQNLKDAIAECEQLREATEQLIASKDVGQIDVASIELIHGIERQQDAYVGLCRKINNGFENLAGVRVSELRQYLPTLVPYLLRDAYFTVNAAWRTQKYSSRATGLPAPARRECQLRYLNACYVDLDCYHGGMDWGEAQATIARAQDANLIPPASIVGRSGRGVYLLWLLGNERKGSGQRAWPNEIELYKHINRNLVKTLNEYEPRLYADINATDAARVLRVPGSISSKSKADMPVEFIVQAANGGRVPTFTLPYLAGYYGIKVIGRASGNPWKHLREGYRATKAVGSAPNRRNGQARLGEHRYQDLLTIAQHRLGIEQGNRWRAICDLCHFTKQADWTLGDIKAEAQRFAASCNPPYPSEANDVAVDDIAQAVWIEPGRRWFKRQTLADRYGVSDDLAAALSLESIVPDSTDTRRKAMPSARAQAQQDRREHIHGRIEQHPGDYPTISSLESSLEAAGLQAARGTVWADLQAVLSDIKSRA